MNKKSQAIILEEMKESLSPPVTQIGLRGWIRANLFSSWFNSLLTILTFLLLLKIVPPMVKWAFVDSLWFSSSEACRDIDGACCRSSRKISNSSCSAFFRQARSGGRLLQLSCC